MFNGEGKGRFRILQYMETCNLFIIINCLFSFIYWHPKVKILIVIPTIGHISLNFWVSVLSNQHGLVCSWYSVLIDLPFPNPMHMLSKPAFFFCFLSLTKAIFIFSWRKWNSFWPMIN